MHNILNRLNAIFFFSVTTLICLGFMSAFTMIVHPGVVAMPKAPEVRELVQLRKISQQDRAYFTFDMDVDLTPVWNWNMHELFVMVTADYSTPDTPRNEVVVWDKIIRSQENCTLKLYDEKIKYPLSGQKDELRGQNFTLHVRWDSIPITGSLYFGDAAPSAPFSLPKRYKQ